MSAAAGSLETLLLQGDWRAVDLAQPDDPRVLPILSKLRSAENYRTRQIVMSAAGKLGAPESAAILAAGLGDSNVNVRLAAASELSQKSYPAAAQAILEQLEKSPDDVVREALALAAGRLPPDPGTIERLRPYAADGGDLAVNTLMALARLGDAAARQAIIQELASPQPRTRYDALGHLRYVGDPALAAHARRLLGDRAEAQRIGVKHAPRYRRVCDQALDTLVFLLKLQVRFVVNAEQIYGDAQLAEAERLTAGRA